MKRLKNVRTEMALSVLAYTLTRVINILGVQIPVENGFAASAFPSETNDLLAGIKVKLYNRQQVQDRQDRAMDDNSVATAMNARQRRLVRDHCLTVQ